MARKINKPSQLTLLSIYSDYLEYRDSSGSSKIKFTPEIVNRLEIVDSIKLDQLIISFISKKQLTKSKIIFILDQEIYFEKKITSPNDDLSIRNFVEKIPLDDVLYKIIPDKTDFRLIAFNRDYLETLKKFFEANGFEVILTIPKFDLDKVGFNLNKSKKEINTLIKTLKTSNLLSDQHYSQPKKSLNFKEIFSNFNFNFFKNINFSKISQTTKLVSVFSVLVVVLVVLIIVQKPFSYSKTILSTPTPIPTTVPTPVPITPATAIIKITYRTTKLISSVTNLKNELIKEGYQNITVQQDSTLGTSQKTYLNFSVNFPSDLKDKITQTSGKYLINSLIQTKDSLGVDVLISAER